MRGCRARILANAATGLTPGCRSARGQRKGRERGRGVLAGAVAGGAVEVGGGGQGEDEPGRPVRPSPGEPHVTAVLPREAPGSGQAQATAASGQTPREEGVEEVLLAVGGGPGAIV